VIEMSWKKILKEDKGLGDTVERVTKATGIKKAVEYVSKKTGKDCGCSARKEYLNERFNYE
jgi:nicotinate-nucleotide pyrophosphorylase